MTLPIILAGPILRRVEPTGINIWMAFSKQQVVEAYVWEGTGPEGNATTAAVKTNSHAHSKPVNTVEIATNLHLAVVTIDTTVSLLKVGTKYSYNVYFHDPGQTTDNDLGTAKLLNAPPDVEAKDFVLGFNINALPSFVIPGDTLQKLHIAHGSCRKIHGVGDDAFARLDRLISKKIDKPEERLQQLFLTGDQIYADEVPRLVLPFINALGKQLFNNKTEVLVLDATANPKKTMPCDMQHFLPACREFFINTTPKLTGTGISSHLLAFQEYCSTYLHYWSPDAWDPDLKKMLAAYKKSFYDEATGGFIYYYLVNLVRGFKTDEMFSLLFKPNDTFKIENVTDLVKALNLPAPAATTDQNKIIDKWKAAYNNPAFTGFDEIVKTMLNVARLSEQQKKVLDRFYTLGSVLSESKRCCDFLDVLPRARRVLANVPTYLIFDDHEITDDWNFSHFWNNRVYTNPTGQQVIRNGMMAYTLFQDWGNVPAEYAIEIFNNTADEETKQKYRDNFGKTKGNKAALLKLISDYGKAMCGGSEPESKGPLSEQLNKMLLKGQEDESADFIIPVRWHFDMATGKAHTFFLDTRTRREYDDFIVAPGLLSQAALDNQLPEKIKDANHPVVFVVSPVPVLGLPVIEEFAQPLAGAGEVSTKEEGIGGAPAGVISAALQRDNEAWGFSEKHIELLLARLAIFKKVVILSGDVHFGYSAFADYWKERKAANHARIIQLVASSMKNAWHLEFVLLKSGFAQRLLSGFDFEFEKHGWKDKDVEVEGLLAPRQRMRLRRNPVMLSRHGWHEGATIKPAEPDWAWRLRIPADGSEYDDLPKESSATTPPKLPLKVTTDLPAENTPAGDGAALMATFQQMAARHTSVMKLGLSRRLVWQSHIGYISFTGTETKAVLRHEFHYVLRSDGFLNSDVAPDPNYAGLLGGPFTVHTINLDADEAEKTAPRRIDEALQPNPEV